MEVRRVSRERKEGEEGGRGRRERKEGEEGGMRVRRVSN